MVSRQQSVLRIVRLNARRHCRVEAHYAKPRHEPLAHLQWLGCLGQSQLTTHDVGIPVSPKVEPLYLIDSTRICPDTPPPSPVNPVAKARVTLASKSTDAQARGLGLSNTALILSAGCLALALISGRYRKTVRLQTAQGSAA